MKAIIPVAGVGTQLRPHTHTQPKPLIPVAGKPILGHIIDNLLASGIDQQVFIVGYLREKIQEYVLRNYRGQVEAEFIVQAPRRGIAHALWLARESMEEEQELMILLGDTIFGDDTLKIKEMKGSILGVHEVDNPRNFGIALLDDNRVVSSLVEKPEIPTSNLALVGLYKISEVPLLLEVLTSLMREERDTRADYTLTEALMRMISKGVPFRTHRVQNWFDCGRKQSLLEANRILLGRQSPEVPPNLSHAVIIPPVHIAPGCDIQHSIIGPNVAIAENATIHNSIVRDSILGAYSRLDSIILSGSVIGNDTTLRGRANQINIGDNTEIDFTD